MKSVQEFLKSGKFLPQPLRDFHDAKDLFKTMHEYYHNSLEEARKEGFAVPNWRDAQVYIIDYFLRYMAVHGWTMQQSRQKVDFCDIYASIEDFNKKNAEAFQEYLNSRREDKDAQN